VVSLIVAQVNRLLPIGSNAPVGEAGVLVVRKETKGSSRPHRRTSTTPGSSHHLETQEIQVERPRTW